MQVTGVGEVLLESGPSFEDAVGQGTLAAEAETSGAGIRAQEAAEPLVLEAELLATARQGAAAPRCSKLRKDLAGGASHDGRASGSLLFLVVRGGAVEGRAEAAAQEGTVDSWPTSAALLALLRANLARGSSTSPTSSAQLAERPWSIAEGASAFRRTQRRLGGGQGALAASSSLAAAARDAATAAGSGVWRCRNPGLNHARCIEAKPSGLVDGAAAQAATE